MTTKELLKRFYTVFQRMHPQKDYFDFLEILPKSEMAVLRTIDWAQASDENLTVTGIAQALGISKPAVSRAMRTLLAKDFIYLQQDETDRRNSFVSMTPSGQKAYADTMCKIHHYIATVFERMDQEELIQFILISEHLIDMMDQVKQDYMMKEVRADETNT